MYNIKYLCEVQCSDLNEYISCIECYSWMVSINYWWHRENNTILIINDWIHWTILDDMKVLLELGMSLKKDRSKQTMQQVGHKSMYIQFINQDTHNQPCVINSNILALKFKFKVPNFASDLHILNVIVTTGLEQECFTYTSLQFLWHYENRECSWRGSHDHSMISC